MDISFLSMSLLFLAASLLAIIFLYFLATTIEDTVRQHVSLNCCDMESRLMHVIMMHNSDCLQRIVKVLEMAQPKDKTIRLKETTCDILEEAHNLLQSGSSLPQDLLTQVNKIKKDATKYRPHTRTYLENRFPLLFSPKYSSQPLTPGNS